MVYCYSRVESEGIVAGPVFTGIGVVFDLRNDRKLELHPNAAEGTSQKPRTRGPPQCRVNQRRRGAPRLGRRSGHSRRCSLSSQPLKAGASALKPDERLQIHTVRHSAVLSAQTRISSGVPLCSSPSFYSRQVLVLRMSDRQSFCQPGTHRVCHVPLRWKPDPK